MTKLILGTASFGQLYGIKGDPVPSLKEIEKIAGVAWNGGIRVIHTSWQYGLSSTCKIILHGFNWITKDHINPNYFWWGNQKGKSLYGPSETTNLYRVLNIPINILDNRFKNIWTHKGGTIVARSVFLQGLLLMEPANFPIWLSEEAGKMIAKFHIICAEKRLKPYEAALGWVLGLKDIDYVIVGVNSAEQLKQLLDVKPLQWDYDFSIQDENILDPRKWPKDV